MKLLNLILEILLSIILIPLALIYGLLKFMRGVWDFYTLLHETMWED